MRGDSGYAYIPAGQAEVEFGKYEERIRQLEKQCATLAAEIDRIRPVVEAAVKWRQDATTVNPDDNTLHERPLVFAVDAYRKDRPQ